jgi:hypothetical protein
MQGRRLPDTQWPDVLPAAGDLRDGDYWLCHGAPDCNEGFDGCWYVCLYGAGGIPRHHVIEHEDGTITIPSEPHPEEGHCNSLLIEAGPGRSWHGYIDRGAWRAC